MRLSGSIISIVGVLVLVFVGALTLAPRGGMPEMAGSTVKILAGGGHGSGIHIGGGYIITAEHVVVSGSASIKLDNGEEQKATILWSSAANDIALLRTEPTMAASALDCRVAADGEAILARGNPLALEFASSSGRVAGAERKMGRWERAVPTDLTVVMGMSGGPSFSADGRVIGINVGVLLASVGMFPSMTGFGVMVPAAVVCDLLAWEAAA